MVNKEEFIEIVKKSFSYANVSKKKQKTTK